jgi:protein-L-isoaspartate(D-aspartate) O-methyltransferase
MSTQTSIMDFDKARYNMVEQQVRPWDVLDNRVLEVISEVPREAFAPDAYKKLAYADTSIPLGQFEGTNCAMLHPILDGRLIQNLSITDDDVVLEIGTGSGYLTACLAKLARHVDSVDINPEMTALAEKNLAAFDLQNINLSTGDASKGWDQKRFYDVIALTGSVHDIPENYKQSLTEGGRLFVIVGEAPVMTAYLVTRISKNEWTTEDLFETCIDPLVHAEVAEAFSF